MTRNRQMFSTFTNICILRVAACLSDYVKEEEEETRGTNTKQKLIQSPLLSVSPKSPSLVSHLFLVFSSSSPPLISCFRFFFTCSTIFLFLFCIYLLSPIQSLGWLQIIIILQHISIVLDDLLQKKKCDHAIMPFFGIFTNYYETIQSQFFLLSTNNVTIF